MKTTGATPRAVPMWGTWGVWSLEERCWITFWGGDWDRFWQWHHAQPERVARVHFTPQK